MTTEVLASGLGETAIRLTSRLRPLDSGLRRNDGGGCVHNFVRNSKGVIGMTTELADASRPAPDRQAEISPGPDNPGLKRLINRNHAAHIPVTIPGHGLAAQVQE